MQWAVLHNSALGRAALTPDAALHGEHLAGHGQAVEHLAADAHLSDLTRAGARRQVVASDALEPVVGALDKRALTQPRGHLPGRAPKALQRRALTTVYATPPEQSHPDSGALSKKPTHKRRLARVIR